MLEAFDDPQTIAAVLGFSFGLLYGESFSELDFKVKYVSQWFKNQSQFWQWVVASFLDANHHFQYGLFLMLLAKTTSLTLPLLSSFSGIILWWAGVGFVVSDWKDYQYVLKRMGLVNSQDSQVSGQDEKK